MKVAFYKATRPGLAGIVNRLIRWWTNSPYSHCELIISESDAGALCASSSYEDNGVRFKTIRLKPENWDIIEVPTTASQEADAETWYRLHDGQPYDLTACIGFVWRRNHRAGHWDCSESIGDAFAVPEAWRFDPGTLYAALLGIPKLGS